MVAVDGLGDLVVASGIDHHDAPICGMAAAELHGIGLGDVVQQPRREDRATSSGCLVAPVSTRSSGQRLGHAGHAFGLCRSIWENMA